MNKREVVLSLLDPETPTPYIPAGFFLFFDARCHHGQAAIDKHLEFFNYTGMDFFHGATVIIVVHAGHFTQQDNFFLYS